MPNTIPITQGTLALDGNRKALFTGWPASRYEDATGGNAEGTAGNITSPQTIDGLTATKLKVPQGAMRMFVRTFAPDGIRIGNNADLTAANTSSGYIVGLQNEWIEVGCQAESSGAAPNGDAASLVPAASQAGAGAGNVNNTTCNPEVYVMLNDADAGEGEVYFYFAMLY